VLVTENVSLSASKRSRIRVTEPVRLLAPDV
jgi:hypothetical protein